MLPPAATTGWKGQKANIHLLYHWFLTWSLEEKETAVFHQSLWPVYLFTRSKTAWGFQTGQSLLGKQTTKVKDTLLRDQNCCQSENSSQSTHPPGSKQSNSLPGSRNLSQGLEPLWHHQGQVWHLLPSRSGWRVRLISVSLLALLPCECCLLSLTNEWTAAHSIYFLQKMVSWFLDSQKALFFLLTSCYFDPYFNGSIFYIKCIIIQMIPNHAN